MFQKKLRSGLLNVVLQTQPRGTMGNPSRSGQYFGFFNPKHPKYKAEILTLCIALYRKINKDR